MSLRSKRRRPTDHIEDLAPNTREELAKDDPYHRPDVYTERAGVFRKLGKALEVLSPIDRRIVTLRLYEGWSTQEVANALDLSLSATKTRLHRARQALQNEMMEHV